MRGVRPHDPRLPTKAGSQPSRPHDKLTVQEVGPGQHRGQFGTPRHPCRGRRSHAHSPRPCRLRGSLTVQRVGTPSPHIAHRHLRPGLARRRPRRPLRRASERDRRPPRCQRGNLQLSHGPLGTPPVRHRRHHPTQGRSSLGQPSGFLRHGWPRARRPSRANAAMPRIPSRRQLCFKRHLQRMLRPRRFRGSQVQPPRHLRRQIFLQQRRSVSQVDP